MKLITTDGSAYILSAATLTYSEQAQSAVITTTSDMFVYRCTPRAFEQLKHLAQNTNDEVFLPGVWYKEID